MILVILVILVILAILAILVNMNSYFKKKICVIICSRCLSLSDNDKQRISNYILSNKNIEFRIGNHNPPFDLYVCEIIKKEKINYALFDTKSQLMNGIKNMLDDATNVVIFRHNQIKSRRASMGNINTDHNIINGINIMAEVRNIQKQYIEL